MSVSKLMRQHRIERVVFVEEFGVFHAWPRDGGGLDHVCGRGPTVEAAIHDCVARQQREAA